MSSFAVHSGWQPFFAEGLARVNNRAPSKVDQQFLDAAAKGMYGTSPTKTTPTAMPLLAAALGVKPSKLEYAVVHEKTGIGAEYAMSNLLAVATPPVQSPYTAPPDSMAAQTYRGCKIDPLYVSTVAVGMKVADEWEKNSQRRPQDQALRDSLKAGRWAAQAPHPAAARALAQELADVVGCPAQKIMDTWGNILVHQANGKKVSVPSTALGKLAKYPPRKTGYKPPPKALPVEQPGVPDAPDEFPVMPVAIGGIAVLAIAVMLLGRKSKPDAGGRRLAES